MSALIRIGADGRAVIVERGDPAPQTATRKVSTGEGGRGDARLATYVKKPVEAKPERDWRAEGCVPLADWLTGERSLAPLLAPTDDPLTADGLTAAPVIAVEFQKFNDGRGLSIAALLRKRLGYRGEIRAVGEVARDQLFYMARCGFDAFVLRADQDPDSALEAFAEFGDVYQDAADDRAPLFRRREDANRAAAAWLRQRNIAP